MYENGFGINNLQWLMCHKTKPNQTQAKFLQFLQNILLRLFHKEMILSIVTQSAGAVEYTDCFSAEE